MPASGRLDEIYDILRSTTTQDAMGQPIETRTVWRSVFLGRKDTRAEERFRANQEISAETTVFVGHYIDGLRYEDQLRRRSTEKLYDIVAIAELGRRSGLEITAVATRV